VQGDSHFAQEARYCSIDNGLILVVFDDMITYIALSSSVCGNREEFNWVVVPMLPWQPSFVISVYMKFIFKCSVYYAPPPKGVPTLT